MCLANEMAMGYAEVSWAANGSPVTSGITTGAAAPQPGGKFSMSSFLSIETSDWFLDKVYSCKVSLGSQSSEKTISKSECGGE